MGFVACSESVPDCLTEDCTVEDSAAALGEASFQRIAWGCCTPDTDESCPEFGAFWYDVVLGGGTDSLVLECSQTDGYGQALYQESHLLPVVYQDPSAGWSSHYLELPLLDSSSCDTLQDCPLEYESGQSSLFSCAGEDLAGLNWTLRITTEDPAVQGECGSWGADLDSSEDCQTLLPDQ